MDHALLLVLTILSQALWTDSTGILAILGPDFAAEYTNWGIGQDVRGAASGRKARPFHAFLSAHQFLERPC